MGSRVNSNFTIVVPYRNRLENLRSFVRHMNEFLFNLPFKILVVEQLDNQPFNRGALLNVGFHLSPESDYLVFHDVDMLPIDESCSYTKPLTGFCHVAGRVQQFGYSLPYANYCGGVLMATRDSFGMVNGFSNLYWGWGCEDDDILARIWSTGIVIERRSGLYRSLPHRFAPLSERRTNQLRFEKVLKSYVQDEWGHPVHPKIFRRVPLTTFKPRVQDHPLNSSDGISTVRFAVHSRQSLGSYIESSIVSSRHTVAGVTLEQ
jgi:hypothetical protein